MTQGASKSEIETACQWLKLEARWEDWRLVVVENDTEEERYDLEATIKRMRNNADQYDEEAMESYNNISNPGYWRGASREMRTGMSGAMSSRAHQLGDWARDLRASAEELEKIWEKIPIVRRVAKKDG